jgi:SWI/SNF-related matrix-associated actin-dependent regulator of chromatin subfamily B protein 1
LIKLNITIGPHTLVDQFEWEINNPLNSPEEFAMCMARDLSLSGEFTTAIAHCIREQSQLFTRSLYIIGHPFDGRPVEDADLVAAFLPSPLPSAFRPHQQAKEYAPYLYELNEVDLERNELIFSREQRRQKRSVNRRGGPTLPDLKDRQRTVRTLIISSVLPGAAESIDDSRIYKRVSGAAGRSKRGVVGGVRDGLGESDSSESDESAPESPALSQLQGTARTRGMRGAATAAQQRMANIGRSETPEAATLHHHETRTSARRFGGRDVREESADGNPTLIVKLKLGRERFRQFIRDRKNGVRLHTPQQQSQSSHNRSQSGFGTPGAGSMGPPLTPGLQNQQLGGKSASTPQQGGNAQQGQGQGQIGRVDAPPPPGSGQQLPPPVSVHSLTPLPQLTILAPSSHLANPRPQCPFHQLS